MGGRGASSGNSKNPHEKFIQSLIGEDMPRGDLQGVIEAYAMSNGLSTRQENAILDKIDNVNNFVYDKATLTDEARKSTRVQKEIKEFAKDNNISAKLLNQKIKKTSEDLTVPF